MNKGLTIIETLIIVAIFAILSIIVISTLDPIEQINRARDTSIVMISETISSSVTRYLVSNKKVPWESSIQTALLSSDQGESLLTNIISIGELKENFSTNNRSIFNELYVTTSETNSNIFLCFQPHSKIYKQHPFSVFYQDGTFNSACFENRAECYFCFGNYEMGEVIASSSNPSNDIEENNQTEEEQLCSNFDPEYPEFAWTCNYSDKWSQYGCTNYCVVDKGCDGYCPSGQRHLVKNYYAVNDNSFVCLAAKDNTAEDYCVTDPSARCDIKSYSSNPSDFVWGCSNPRRPYEWVN